MSSEVWLWQFDRTIPSQWEAGQQLVDEVVHRLGSHQWDEHERFSVSLALTEAVVNAIRHGNLQDLNKQVRVTCKLSRRRLLIEVADQGPGFDPSRVPDPTAPDRLEIPSGRGLMLMRSYMNRVQYNDRGNAVVMEKLRNHCS
jgi:serine/threonine-protein kinase RsbW